MGKECDFKSIYLFIGIVFLEMYLGYDEFFVDMVKDKILKNIYFWFCKNGVLFCDIKYKVNVLVYMWIVGVCYDLIGNCKIFLFLVKNDGYENFVGFYSFDILEIFFGVKFLMLSICWINKKFDRDFIVN